jgi:hypothetical protein
MLPTIRRWQHVMDDTAGGAVVFGLCGYRLMTTIILSAWGLFA